MAFIFFVLARSSGPTDGRTAGRTDGRPDGRTAGRTDTVEYRDAETHLKSLKKLTKSQKPANQIPETGPSNSGNRPIKLQVMKFRPIKYHSHKNLASLSVNP